MTYSEKVKYARDKLLLTQEEMAEALGVNEITICRWETGKFEPSIKAKKAIKEFCDSHNIMFED